MGSSSDWACAKRVADVCLHGHRQVDVAEEPALVVQRVARNPILCAAPTEYFSREMPVWQPDPADHDDLRPIDVLYGCYEPTSREIKVFVNRIEQDAPIYGAEARELCDVVRIQEYCHAVVHLGIRADDVHERLREWGPGDRTEWSDFVTSRTSWFLAVDPKTHEFLAQALAYAALQRLNDWEGRFRKIFDALEAKQPARYRLSPEVKQHAGDAHWALILDAARERIGAHRGEGFTWKAGLEALVCGPRA